jgi:predicted DNA-binding transcriptional regulator YafY
VNRTDRLYALVEELRVISPRPRSGRWLSRRFGVSIRTIERDINALQQAGSPIWAEPGRTGGYCLDRQKTLPPVNFTPAEAVAVAVALEKISGSPFHQAAQTALRKLVTVMRDEDADAARDLAERVHLLDDLPAGPPTTNVIADALSSGRVLRIGYLDKGGDSTSREVEPLGYVGRADHWYLIGWCRLRGGLRAFRTDRITSCTVTTEVPEPRELRSEDLDIPLGEVRQLRIL